MQRGTRWKGTAGDPRVLTLLHPTPAPTEPREGRPKGSHPAPPHSRPYGSRMEGSYENIHAPARVLVAISLADRASNSPGQRNDRQQHGPARHGGLPHRSVGARPIAGLAQHP